MSYHNKSIELKITTLGTPAPSQCNFLPLSASETSEATVYHEPFNENALLLNKYVEPYEQKSTCKIEKTFTIAIIFRTCSRIDQLNPINLKHT